MIYKCELDRMLTEMNEYRIDLEDELRHLPEGDFFSYKSRGVVNYCERLPATGNRKKERRIGVKSDPVRCNQLVRKKYVVSALDNIISNIDILRKASMQYRPFDENSIMKDFIEKHPDLTDGIYYGHASGIDWADAFEQQNDFHNKDLKSLSADGGKRRSLGEIIIGARLSHYGIPYRYEAGINHPDIPFVPDFTIRRPRDSKIIYWEHLGMVNDPDYISYNKNKFSVYEDYGIVPWDNLIVSYSQCDGGINEKLIDALINGWLL